MAELRSKMLGLDASSHKEALDKFIETQVKLRADPDALVHRNN